MPYGPTRTPLHPQHHRAMPRNWSAEPEDRMISNLAYRGTRYGGGQTPPSSLMRRNLRQQEADRRTTQD